MNIAFFIPLFLLILLLPIVSAYQVSVEGGTLDIKINVGGKEYSDGPVTAKMVESDTFDVSVDYGSTQSRIGLKLEESNPGFLTVVSGDPLNTFKNYTGPTNGKQNAKWTLKTTGSVQSVILKLHFDFIITTGSVNVGILSLKPLQPTKIISVTPSQITPEYSGNLTIVADILPKEIGLGFLLGSAEDSGITAKQVDYKKPDTAVYEIDVNKDASGGPRSLRLTTPSGISYTFQDKLEVLGKSSEFAPDLKLEHQISEDRSITFYAHAANFTGIPKISISTDPAKASYSMDLSPTKAGTFVFKSTYDKVGIREGIPFSYTVIAGKTIKVNTDLIPAPSATPESSPVKTPAPTPKSPSKTIESLEVSKQTKILFRSLIYGLTDLKSI